MSGSIIIMNHSDKAIEVLSIKEFTSAEFTSNAGKDTIKIEPNDYFVFFTDKFKSLVWKKDD